MLFLVVCCVLFVVCGILLCDVIRGLLCVACFFCLLLVVWCLVSGVDCVLFTLIVV